MNDRSSAAALLLDCLLDPHPDQAQDRLRTAAETLADLRASVARDVEALLKARRPWRSVDRFWSNLRVSPLSYGIPDFTAGAFNDPREREALRARIERAIARFEPRLAAVYVQLVESTTRLRSTLVLRIDAILLIHRQPEQISSDTLIETTTAGVTPRRLQEA